MIKYSERVCVIRVFFFIKKNIFLIRASLTVHFLYPDFVAHCTAGLILYLTIINNRTYCRKRFTGDTITCKYRNKAPA